MNSNDQLKVLRLLKDAHKASSINQNQAKKWQDFANQLIENIPIAHLNEYDLTKLQAFTITLTSLKILDESKHETMLRWAITERYRALQPILMEQVADGNSADLITAIEQLSLLQEEKLAKELLLKIE